MKQKKVNKMEQRILVVRNGVYYVDINITVEEWKELLVDDHIFDKNSRDMLNKWYLEPLHQATHRAILDKYGIQGNTPFNGYVKGLSIRVLAHLNRFYVTEANGKKSYFCIPFEGWHQDYKVSKHFIWKIRDELVQAMEELGLAPEASAAISDETQHPDEELESTCSYKENPEGKRVGYFTTKYERNAKNRAAAIRAHGTICSICGFDFEKTYGEIGRNYIEVHHIVPLFERNQETDINPKTDLICVCANCHRMLHRRKNETLEPKQLQKMLISTRNT